MRLSDFDYELPPERIAQAPVAVRDEARLLVHERGPGRTQHRRVRELGELLRAGDLLVLNDTRVLHARLFARRASGGRVELLLVEPSGREGEWRALVHPARRLRAEEGLALEGGSERVRLVARERTPEGAPAMEWRVRLEDAAGRVLDPLEVMARAGHVPLPPYVTRPDAQTDVERYQTVYARVPGAVAAPTAGLHFTPGLLADLAARGIERASVTLHVGPGTFQPVKSARVEEHVMHAERFELPPETAAAVRATRARGGRVVAVGTTVVRVLESSVEPGGEVRPGRGETRLFLVPGAEFRATDALLTNFHLPRSTLLMLVCAFAGRERVLGLYREALDQGYRFYSYGDAMLLL
ncbi:MAG TPA: tRNA preQ1(34) S-adenosylmethionine ribosyltransferase-isomerase QueA [Planctomycetota bacterium]